MILAGLPGLVVVLLAFCLWHASVSLGVRPALAFLSITVITSWVFEEVGVLTGLIYGPYHYTPVLGPWLGSVPILIPLAWFVLIYPTYSVVNLVRGGWPVGTSGGRAHLVALALLGAVLMVAWDLLIDPVLSGPTVGAWVWERGGPWYGVPIHNSLGWLATSFTIFLLYRWVERRSGAQAAARASEPSAMTSSYAPAVTR